MLIPTGTLVMVVDGAKMLLLRNQGDAAAPELETLAHEVIDNPANRDQVSDAPGLSFSSMGSGRSAHDQTDLHQQNEDRFAAKAAAALCKAAEDSEGDLIVIAPPRTLSILRRHYDPVVADKLLAEIDKDLTKHPVDEISRLIASYEP